MTNTTQPMAEVLELENIDRTQIAAVGGKAANLGELSRLAGLHVPAGLCVTTGAFRRMLATSSAIADALDRLAALTANDRDEIREHSRELRRRIEATPIPADLQAALDAALTRLGPDDAYAVRSSATAEDLPGASFAGQQDTFLNVRGTQAIGEQLRRCWASLFSERAVSYRIQHGFDHHEVHMAVVIQKMVPAQAAGVVFTADPINGDRKVATIEAVPGLGEALVSGQATPDRYRVRNDQIVDRTSARTQLLTDAQILALARLARDIEAHFAAPQDIEWCLLADTFHVVQARPITTLYPVPDAGDDGNHVYVSVGHQQMMTDAMKPLGLSVRQRTSGGAMHAAGGRLFADATPQLASPATRDALLDVARRSDPLIADALEAVLARGDFIAPAPPGASAPRAIRFNAEVDDDPAIVTTLIERSEAAVAALQRDIESKTGVALIEFIGADLERLKQSLFDPPIMGVIMAGMNATTWLNDHMLAWLGEKNAADTLSQSVDHNITSQMGLDLLAVADVIRPYPQVIAYLQQARRDDFLGGMATLPGGPQSRAAIQSYLDRYGMRCAGEIDITRPRWREQPTTLVPLILANIKNFAPHAGAQKFAAGREEALARAQALIDRLRQLPDGEHKARETRRRIDRLRSFIGYREYPKYDIVSRYFVYKQALQREAGRLVQAGVITDREDIDYLTFDELHEVVRTQHLDPALVRQRRAEHELHTKLTPPRVITSDGEIVASTYHRADLPAGALVGLPVSSGVVEGRARVLLDMADAELAAGDILVTRFTDPSWTPLFVALRGLVTEVGGLMTHGAVIAREYGLTAVVGVEHATTRIRDGQRIRVNGSDGHVEILG